VLVLQEMRDKKVNHFLLFYLQVMRSLGQLIILVESEQLKFSFWIILEVQITLMVRDVIIYKVLNKGNRAGIIRLTNYNCF